MELIRTEKIYYCIGFTFLMGVGLLYAGIWSLNTGLVSNALTVSKLSTYLWAACGLFFAGASLSLAFISRSARLAGWILCLFVSGGIIALLPRFQSAFAIVAFLLPVLFSALIFDLKQMAVFLALIVGVSTFWNIYHFYEQGFFSHVLAPGLVVLFTSFFIIFTIHSLLLTLKWYEKNYVLERYNKQIIRDNEVELERLVKALRTQKEYLKANNELLVVVRDQAEQAKKAKQIFVQNVSHELLTPLNLIIGFAETMVNTPKAYAEVNWTPELKEDVDCIYQYSQHLKSLIDDVLRLAALENNSFSVHPDDFDLHTLIRETAQIRRDSFTKKKLFMKLNLDSDPLIVRADAVRIKQVILNLLSNVLKATEKGGVTVSTSRDGGFAGVQIKDTGKGIPESALGRVFEVFYQVDKSSSAEDSGTGLGLSISKALVELNGGEINISSQVGVGTLVSFTLPLAKQGSAASFDE